MKAPAVVSALCLAAVLASSGATATAASDPPVVAVGPVSGPNGTATASGSSASNAQTDACVNNQHSGVNPSASSASGTVQLTDRACNTAAQADSSAQSGGAQANERQATGRTSSSGTAASGGTTGSRAVNAANAIGLRIASIRIDKRGIAKAHRMRVLVTIRDQRMRVVRYAVISLGCAHGARGVTGCTQSTFSNRLGRGAFQLRLGKQASGRRISIAVTARTPNTRVWKLVTVRLPK